MTDRGSASLPCPICSLDLQRLSLAERDAHSDACADRRSDPDDALDVISISSTDLSPGDSSWTTSADVVPSQGLVPGLAVRSQISSQFADLLKHCRSKAVNYSSEDDAASPDPEESATTRLESESLSPSAPTWPQFSEGETSPSDDDGQATLVNDRRVVVQHNLLRRLQESGKVSGRVPAETPAVVIQDRSRDAGPRHVPSAHAARSCSEDAAAIRERLSPDSDTALRRSAADQFHCWLCDNWIGLGSITPADHLAFCARLSRDLLDAVLPEIASCATMPDTLCLDRLDALIDKLQTIRKAVQDQRSTPSPPSESQVGAPDSHASVDDDAQATARIRAPAPPCPDYSSMPVAELKKRMANYGFRAGPKPYMVRQLALAWQALHSTRETPPPLKTPVPTADAALPATDSFRSPVRHRTRKVGDEPGTNRDDAIWDFIVGHERLLEYIICVQPVDVTDLHTVLIQSQIAVSVKEVRDFCRHHGLNVTSRRPSSSSHAIVAEAARAPLS